MQLNNKFFLSSIYIFLSSILKKLFPIISKSFTSQTSQTSQFFFLLDEKKSKIIKIKTFIISLNFKYITKKRLIYILQNIFV